MVEGGKRVETDGPNLLLTQAEKLLVSIKEERFEKNHKHSEKFPSFFWGRNQGSPNGRTEFQWLKSSVLDGFLYAY